MKLSQYKIDLNIMSIKFLCGKVLCGIDYWKTDFSVLYWGREREKKEVKSLAASVFTELFSSCIKWNKVFFIVTKKGTATRKAHAVVFM